MPAQNRALLAAALLAAGIGISACGITDPYAGHGRSAPPPPTSTAVPATTSVAATDADPAAERGGTIPATAHSAQQSLADTAGHDTPQRAVAGYARLYSNWTATTIARVQRRLASISLDGARAQALQAAARYEHDSTLAGSRIANSGTVVSIAVGEGAARGEWVVVTREHTSGDGDYAGLPAALHVIYARVAQEPTGWVVTEWSPQS